MRRIIALVAIILALAACGSGQPGEIDQEAVEDLSARVAAVRAAADTGERGALIAELDDLRRAVEAHRAEGRIDDERANHIAAALDDVEAHAPADDPAPNSDPEPDPEPEAEQGGGPPDDKDPPGRERGRGGGN